MVSEQRLRTGDDDDDDDEGGVRDGAAPHALVRC
jgi:hypothetical protein